MLVLYGSYCCSLTGSMFFCIYVRAQHVDVEYEFHLMLLTGKFPDSKIHGANMGPTWVLSAPGGPHVRPINLVIKVLSLKEWRNSSEKVFLLSVWMGFEIDRLVQDCGISIANALKFPQSWTKTLKWLFVNFYEMLSLRCWRRMCRIDQKFLSEVLHDYTLNEVWKDC